MKFLTTKLPIALVVLTFISHVKGGSIANSLLAKLQSQATADAVIELPSVMNQVLDNLSRQNLTGEKKASTLVYLLKSSTSSSQAPFTSLISRYGLFRNAQPFFIVNRISLKSANLSVIQSLGDLPGNFTIREPIAIQLDPVLDFDEAPSTAAPRRVTRQAEPQYGVSRINAPIVWSTKTRGEGVVVAGIDTGVFQNHESLRNNYANSWFDAVNGRAQPYDDNGHGTHTMGTILGANGIGVAPGAKWIACKALNAASAGDDVTMTSCGQWVLQQRPKVVCNSWSSAAGGTYYNDIILAWKAAGIIPVFSSGNSGPQCGTTKYPGDSKEVISVGATDYFDKITSFSSRGRTNTSTAMKPTLSAPGQHIWSASHTEALGYVTMSGTSMAAPHVVGAVALMLAAKPTMTFSDVFIKLVFSTNRNGTVTAADFACGRASTATYPNNAYGWGRLDVRRAIEIS